MQNWFCGPVSAETTENCLVLCLAFYHKDYQESRWVPPNDCLGQPTACPCVGRCLASEQGKDFKVWRGVFPNTHFHIKLWHWSGSCQQSGLWPGCHSLKCYDESGGFLWPVGFHCYIRRSQPSGGQGSRESSCKSVSHSCPLPSSPWSCVCWQPQTHRVMWLIWFFSDSAVISHTQPCYRG